LYDAAHCSLSLSSLSHSPNDSGVDADRELILNRRSCKIKVKPGSTDIYLCWCFTLGEYVIPIQYYYQFKKKSFVLAVDIGDNAVLGMVQ